MLIGKNQLFATLVCMPISVQIALAKEIDAVSLYRSFSQEQSPVHAVNAFTVRSFSAPTARMMRLNQGNISVRLVTPLNSEFHRAGDMVFAEVISSSLPNGKVWLPKGTVLSGYVEGADKAGYAQRDGVLCLRFYDGCFAGQKFAFNSAPNTADAAMHPQPGKLTKKRVARNIIMSATFIAVPLAIGSGGTSLAITTGAGALIGGALAEPGHHISGAMEGAWQGSGLSFLDPVVRKGKKVVLPEGTQFALQLKEPIQLPESIVIAARREEQSEAVTAAQLETKALLMPSQSTQREQAEPVEKECRRYLAQNDLASALNCLDKAIAAKPNEQLAQLRERLLLEIVGGAAGSSTH